MRTDFESTQSVQVYGPDDTGGEVSFTVGLQCTAGSFAGSFDPRWGGEPPSGPEFDVTSITVTVEKVNWKGEVQSTSTLELTCDQLAAVYGREVADKVLDDAMQDAADSGEF